MPLPIPPKRTPPVKKDVLPSLEELKEKAQATSVKAGSSPQGATTGAGNNASSETKPSPSRKKQVRKSKEASAGEEVIPQGLSREEFEAGWRIDKGTGLKYKSLPKQVINSEGFSESHMDDDNDPFSDLNSFAKKYIPQLQVPPSKEEQERLKRDRLRQQRLQNEEYGLEQDNLEKILHKKEEERLRKLGLNELLP